MVLCIGVGIGVASPGLEYCGLGHSFSVLVALTFDDYSGMFTLVTWDIRMRVCMRACW